MGSSLQAAVLEVPIYSVVLEPIGKVAANYSNQDDADDYASTYNLISCSHRAVVKRSISDRVYGRLLPPHLSEPRCK